VNRLRLCSAFRLDGLRFETSGITDDDEAKRTAIDRNAARRQMDAEAIQAAKLDRVARVAEARSEGKSLRTIAEEEGIDTKQVQRDLKATSGVDTVHTSTVKGLTVEPPR
jgi:predicted phage gp36 major capsid-like protein